MTIATQQRNDRLANLAIAGAWAVLFLVGVYAYWPGLKGPFMLDDFGTIAALGNLGGVTDWHTFKAFVLGGHSGPTGRPLALLSFLIDANNWPTDAWPFKRTNLVIHLTTGVLLGVLISRILQLLRFDKREARWIALVSAGCWILHPFLVSTTLYAVQRMAQLSTLFIFAGLIVFLYGRLLVRSNSTKAYLIMSVSVVVFTFLAMVSKENGILLPILIGVVELTVVASQQPRLQALNRNWAIAFIATPSAVVVLYLGTKFFSDDFFEVVAPRDFSIYERLLTQPRILVDYLRHWFIPSLYTTGVFQDHFVKSSGLFTPVTTVLSALVHVAVIAIAMAKRRRWPIFALAALFFYASHLLESTVINLELYFEHRNYLAAAFLSLPLVVVLKRKAARQVFWTIVVSLFIVLTGFTRFSSTIWQDFPTMIEISARKAPTSPRAQAQYATQLFNAQRFDESLQVVDKAIREIPGDNPLLLVNRLIILCQMGTLEATDFSQSANKLSAVPYDGRSIKLYTSLTSSVINGKCPKVSLDALSAMYVNMLQVPYNANPESLAYSQIKYFIGFVSAYSDKPSQAVAAFEESLQARPGASHAMIMAAHLATGEYYGAALHFSDLALSQLDVEMRGVLQGPRVNENDIREFQAIVRADMEALQDEDSIQDSPQ